MQCALFLQTMINDSGKDNDFLPVQMKRRKPWRKVLYEDQGVPDNYVDKSFLDEMRKNREYSTLRMRIYIKLQSLVYRFCDALYWCAACAPFGCKEIPHWAAVKYWSLWECWQVICYLVPSHEFECIFGMIWSLCMLNLKTNYRATYEISASTSLNGIYECAV